MYIYIHICIQIILFIDIRIYIYTYIHTCIYDTMVTPDGFAERSHTRDRTARGTAERLRRMRPRRHEFQDGICSWSD